MRGRTRTRRLTTVVAAALLLAAPLVLHAQSRAALGRARRLLERLKLVDGAGSGLDADTVRGASPLLVRDAAGAVVGTLLSPDVPVFTVARRIDGRAMRLDATAAGFVDTTCPILCYESADCSGTPYREASDAFFPLVEVCGTTAYYPIGSAATRTMVRCRIAGGPCDVQPSPVDQSATTIATFEIGSLGVVPPFHLEGP